MATANLAIDFLKGVDRALDALDVVEEGSGGQRRDGALHIAQKALFKSL